MGPFLPGHSKAAGSLPPPFTSGTTQIYTSSRNGVTHSLSLSLPSFSFPTWETEMLATSLQGEQQVINSERREKL